MNGYRKVVAPDDGEDLEKLSLKEIFARLDAAGAADFVLEREDGPHVERDWTLFCEDDEAEGKE